MTVGISTANILVRDKYKIPIAQSAGAEVFVCDEQLLMAKVSLYKTSVLHSGRECFLTVQPVNSSLQRTEETKTLGIITVNIVSTCILYKIWISSEGCVAIFKEK